MGIWLQQIHLQKFLPSSLHFYYMEEYGSMEGKRQAGRKKADAARKLGESIRQILIDTRC